MGSIYDCMTNITRSSVNRSLIVQSDAPTVVQSSDKCPDQATFQPLASLKTLLAQQAVCLLRGSIMEQCTLITGESGKMSMILHGGFISLDDVLVGVYILFYQNLIGFLGAVEYP